MSALEHHSIEPLIEQLISHAEEELPASERALFTTFVRLYYSQARLDDFEDKTPKNLYGMAKSHWELLKHCRPKELKIRVFNPDKKQDGWESRHTIIEVVTEDMPFIVDSMRMELNKMGMTIHLMIYMGGMKIERDERGKVLDILPYNSKTKDLEIESPIYMEIDRQTDKVVLENIQASIARVLKDVRLSVDDWGKMQERLRETIEIISSSSDMPQKPSEVNETIAFLEWMLEDHFTFLGARDYEKTLSDDNKEAMRLIPGTGLGVLRDEARSKVLRKYLELPKAAREIALSKDQILIISKTNTRSTMHRPTYTDYIGVKLFDKNGNIITERRFIGLYTSSAYTANPKAIPFIRKKVVSIFKRSGLPVRSHAGKDLMHILSTLPRDDLFQGTIDELYTITMGILHLQERRRIRLFVRQDSYGRYLSCLVYLPRENFNTDVLHRMMNLLKKEFNAIEINFNTYFSASILARIHFVVRLDPAIRLQYNIQKLEERLAEVGKSWQDGFREAVLDYFGEEFGNQIVNKYRHAFPAGYREAFLPDNAVKDIEHIESLSEANSLGMSFYRPPEAARDVIKFKLFRADQNDN